MSVNPPPAATPTDATAPSEEVIREASQEGTPGAADERVWPMRSVFMPDILHLVDVWVPHTADTLRECWAAAWQGIGHSSDMLQTVRLTGTATPLGVATAQRLEAHAGADLTSDPRRPLGNPVESETPAPEIPWMTRAAWTDHLRGAVARGEVTRAVGGYEIRKDWRDGLLWRVGWTGHVSCWQTFETVLIARLSCVDTTAEADQMVDEIEAMWDPPWHRSSFAPYVHRAVASPGAVAWWSRLSADGLARVLQSRMPALRAHAIVRGVSRGVSPVGSPTGGAAAAPVPPIPGPGTALGTPLVVPSTGRQR